MKLTLFAAHPKTLIAICIWSLGNSILNVLFMPLLGHLATGTGAPSPSSDPSHTPALSLPAQQARETQTRGQGLFFCFASLFWYPKMFNLIFFFLVRYLILEAVTYLICILKKGISTFVRKQSPFSRSFGHYCDTQAARAWRRN